MTFYLKYRPQTLDELDQASVRQSLQRIFDSGHIPHALLFSGPKGTGKTSAARIFAKMVNCENPKKDGSPCNECDQCLSIAKSSNIDVFELDAASHRGIEDIRAIRDAVKLAPARAKKKIYIIDEAHMLTTEASNALLKTLEEPPEHVIFILATTNPEKLIETIRSRATTIAFKKGTIQELESSLTKIAKGENIKADKSVLELVAKASDGSFRDASKIFEQVLTEVDNLTKENVEKLLSIQDIFDVDQFLGLLKNSDTKEALKFVEESVEKGAGAKDILEKVVSKLRILLLSKVGLGAEKTDFTKEDLIRLIKLFTDASAGISYSLIEQMPLEVAVIEWCENEAAVGNATGGVESENKGGEPQKTAERAKNKSEDAGQKVEIGKDTKIQEKEATSTKEEFHNGNGNTPMVRKDGESVEITEEIWGKVLLRMKPDHTSTEALLRAAKPLEFDGSNLTLGVFYKFHKERLEGAPHRDILEKALLEQTGSKIRVICILTEPGMEKGSPYNPHISETRRSDGGEVILTEPHGNNFDVNATLTDGGGEDIIKIAEKIFGN